MSLPPKPLALFRAGNSLLTQGRAAEALADFDAALQATGPHADILNSRGIALRILGRLDEAVQAFDMALALRPDNALVHANRGAVLTDLGRHAEAIESLDIAIRLQPDNAASWSNSATALREVDRFEDALSGYAKALALVPAYPDALIGRGLALMDLKRLDAAKADFARALALQPDHPKAHLNAAMCALLAGDLADGFAGYEWRWRNPPNSTWVRDFAQPLWLGREDITGKTLLLHAEQGMGDTIQFCRYAMAAADRGARVILEVQRPLQALLSTLEGPAAVIARGDALPAFDIHCPLMSLPLAFGTAPAPIPYLSADPARAADWAGRLGPGPRVGLAWGGNPALKNDRHRSIPLHRFAPLIAGGMTFVSLQKDLRPGDGALIGQWENFAHFGDDLHDFAETAALINALDVVVAVDTAVAHLAGAMGKTVYILLPDIGVDWRWMTARADSPWYPTARLLRQPTAGDWDSVIARLGEELGRALQ